MSHLTRDAGSQVHSRFFGLKFTLLISAKDSIAFYLDEECTKLYFKLDGGPSTAFEPLIVPTDTFWVKFTTREGKFVACNDHEPLNLFLQSAFGGTSSKLIQHNQARRFLLLH